MVDSESAVLPAPAAFDPADSGDSSSESESDAPFASRPSRPFQDNGWMDGDHYSEADVPTDCHNASEWTEKYKDLDEIQVNGAIKRQWKIGIEEVKQIIKQCQKVIGKESIRRADMSNHFYGPNSPLSDLFRRRLKWDHDHFTRWLSTSMRLSSNQWTTAKLYDKEHPQLNVDQCMEEAEYWKCWEDINTCGVPETLEESANSEVPLWEAVQAVVNNQLRAFAIEGRSGKQSVVIDDHKRHCKVNPSKHRNLNVKFIKHVADPAVGH